MPSIKTITPILGGRYYHIFNRGVNRQNIFCQERNYQCFLDLIARILFDYIDVLAYCLLDNHFHLIIRVKDAIEVNKEETSLHDEPKLQVLTDEIEIGKFVSSQFKRLFITYSMAINKQENRVSALFDAKFKRLEIDKQEYLEYSIFYVHHNPVKHKILNAFKNYKFSSFKAVLSENVTKINRKLVFDIFGGKKEFIDFHNGWHEERAYLNLE